MRFLYARGMTRNEAMEQGDVCMRLAREAMDEANNMRVARPEVVNNRMTTAIYYQQRATSYYQLAALLPAA